LDICVKLKIKPLLLVTVFSLFASTLFAAQTQPEVGYKVGQIAPEFKLKSLSGELYTLDKLRSKGPVMLVFWAVECVYCYAHVRDFNELHAKYHDKGLTIAAINIGAEYNDDIAGYVKDNKINYLILSNRLDNLDAGEAYHAVVTPTMVLVNPAGRVIYYGHSLPDVSKLFK